MTKLLAVTAVALLAVLAVQAFVQADGVVVNPAPGGDAKVIRVGEGGQPGGFGYYAAYAPPVPVPPGVAGPYNLPCAYSTTYGRAGGFTAEYLARELGERKGQ